MSIDIDVNKSVELINTIPAFGLINDVVEVPTADPDTKKTSLIIKIAFFLFKLFYFFLN